MRDWQSLMPTHINELREARCKVRRSYWYVNPRLRLVTRSAIHSSPINCVNQSIQFCVLRRVFARHLQPSTSSLNAGPTYRPTDRPNTTRHDTTGGGEGDIKASNRASKLRTRHHNNTRQIFVLRKPVDSRNGVYQRRTRAAQRGKVGISPFNQ